MPAARNDLTQDVWSKLLLLSVTLPLLPGSAFAQIGGPSSSSGSNPLMPGISMQKGQKQLTPEEQEKQRQLDADYKAATNKIPDQKGATDPWASVRPSPTAQKKKQQ
jgi:hypothetical protein